FISGTHGQAPSSTPLWSPVVNTISSDSFARPAYGAGPYASRISRTSLSSADPTGKLHRQRRCGLRLSIPFPPTHSRGPLTAPVRTPPQSPGPPFPPRTPRASSIVNAAVVSGCQYHFLRLIRAARLRRRSVRLHNLQDRLSL